MKFVSNFRKVVGMIVIIISIIFGMTTVGIAEPDDLFATAIMYLMIGLFPFFLGFYVMNGKYKLKEALPMFRIYTGVTIFIPLVLQLADYLTNGKNERLSTPSDIYLDILGGSEWIFYLHYIPAFFAFITFLGLYMFGRKNLPNYAPYLFIISLILTIGLTFFTKDDYRAIREEGLFSSIQGKDEKVAWTEIEKVYLSGFVSRDGYSKTATASFKWEYIFHLKNGGQIVYGPFGYSEYHLTVSHAIKNKIMEERLAMSSDFITEKEWGYIEVDMDYESGDPNDFYSLFQYNPETEDYYDIPYE